MTRQPVVNSGRIFLGIDPGLSGCLAAINVWTDGDRPTIVTYDVPTMQIAKRGGKGKKTVYDRQAFLALLEPFRGLRVIAGLEELFGYPGASSQSVFGMGRGFGMWEMALTAHQIPLVLVTPQKWKRALDVLGKPGQDDKSRKAESVLRAQELFPWVKFPLQRDHNKADAVLLAEFMRRNYPL